MQGFKDLITAQGSGYDIRHLNLQIFAFIFITISLMYLETIFLYANNVMMEIHDNRTKLILSFTHYYFII